MPRNNTFLSAGDIPVFLSIHVPGGFHLRNFLSIAIYLGTTVHSERLLAVSNVCEAAAATTPAKPAATLEAKGGTGPASSRFLKSGKRLGKLKCYRAVPIITSN